MNFMMRRRLKRSLAVYLCTTVVLFFLTDLFLYQWPSSRRQQYDNATQRVLSALEPISNFDKSILPNTSTVILEPSAGLTCQKSGSGLFLLVMVISSPENVKRRENIRSTWTEMQPKWEEQFHADRVLRNNELNVTRVFQLLFFVGQSADSGISDDLRNEWERNGDVVVDDLQESYLKLTVKTLRMIKWTLANCPGAKYLLKMDDDVFLNVPKFVRFLLDQRAPGFPFNSRLVAGHPYREVGVDRDPYSKWFTPEVLYSHERFPSFVGGFCYVMGMQAAQEIFEESRKVPLFHLEDVFLTGLVANKRLKIDMDDAGPIVSIMLYYHRLRSLRWALSQVVIHEATPSEFRCWSKYTLEDENEFSNWWPAFLSCNY